MNLQLNPGEVGLLTQLVESRVEELGPELRRSERQEFHDRLKEERETLQKLLHQLHEAAFDPTC